jgi:hypothetical protein
MPSTPLVESRSPSCRSALAAMKRSSSPPPWAEASPKATLRTPVRVFCTGMDRSRSITSVTSLVKGSTCVTWPSTPRESITGEPAATPWVRPWSMTILRV